MALGHEVLVANGPWVENGGTADQLSHHFGDVVLEDLVDERVATLDEMLQGRCVGVGAPHVGNMTLGA
jgi:hypothetical protein